MTQSRIPDRPALYVVAERFVKEGLSRDGSLFAPGQAVWRTDVIEDFYEHFAVEYDESKRTFEEKLGDQLADVSRDVAQFAGELFFVYCVISVTMKPETKEQLVNFALSRAEGTTEIPRDLRPALKTGMAAPGPGLNQHRFWMVRFFVEFLRAWKRDLTQEKRDLLLRDGWAFREFLFSVKMDRAQTVRAALLHLVHPDLFEPIVSERHKKQIAGAFSVYAPGEPDDDRALYLIREKLTPRFGEQFNYYVPSVRGEWDDEPWRTFIAWAGRFKSWEGFDREERDYKLALAEQLAGVRNALTDGSEWLGLVKEALDAVRKSSLLPWRSVDSLQEWIERDPDVAGEALTILWNEQTPLAGRIDAFVEAAGQAVTRSQARTTAVLLLAIDPRRYPCFAARAVNKGYQLTGFAPPSKTSSPGEKYEHALAFFGRVVSEAEKDGVVLRDLLDAQSVLWTIVKYDADKEPIVHWSSEDKTAFLKFRGKDGPVEDEEESPRLEIEKPHQPGSVEELAHKILIDEGFIRQAVRLLKAKRQIIFYGPPGTGKTFVARKLAQHVAGDSTRVRLVQFHASYTYEDFVEGYRPAKDGGFTLVDGPLKEIAQRARNAPEHTFVLIIDELNRGNAAKVFGELYFLLEYRDEAIRLQYSQEAFSLPANLLIIGTMNTADRSIALIDAALRRRFFFAPFFPDQPPVAGLLKRWLHRENPSLSWVADVVDLANKRMADPHFAIGPSHFMQPDLDEEWVELIWKHSIEPYLEERYFGQPQSVAEFDLATLKSQIISDVSDDADVTHS